MLQAALAGQNEPSVWTPPRIVQRPDNFDDCLVDATGRLPMDNERNLDLTISADGTIKEFSLPEGSPDWMKELAGCATRLLKFSPANGNEGPVEAGASLMMKFRASGPDHTTGLAIERVGPLTTPPRIWIKGAAISACLETAEPIRGSVSRFVITFTVLPDGSVENLVPPPGGERWHEQVSQCILRRAKFSPGTRDGVPVVAEAKMPIVLKTDGSDQGKFIAPVLRTTDEELEAAYRACYPPDSLTMTSALYSFNIGTGGKVGNPRLVKGTGDSRLDEAGTCILKRLEFKPMMLNDRAVRSLVTWELPLRPHR